MHVSSCHKSITKSFSYYMTQKALYECGINEMKRFLPPYFYSSGPHHFKSVTMKLVICLASRLLFVGDSQHDILCWVESHIRITCPCNVYPLTPHFYIVKLGFTGVYIIFLFLL